MKPVVYIASPYTKGDTAQNVRKPFLIAEELVDAGYLPYPPLYTHFWHYLSPHDYDYWVALDLEWILHCDCILRLPGESSGADNEIKFAQEHNIPVYYSITELQFKMPAK
jgi:hypothetical protein